MKIKNINIVLFTAFTIVLIFTQCKVDEVIPLDDIIIHPNPNYNYGIYDTTPYNLQYPSHFNDPEIPSDNPMTINGVKLGRYLFYDKILSSGDVMSCESCHKQEYAFTSPTTTNTSMSNGQQVERNVMSLVNLAWETDFAWDGRKSTLEDKIDGTLNNPFSFNIDWTHISAKLNSHTDYPRYFHEAFGVTFIEYDHVLKALAQFLRSIVSGNSKWDQFLQSTYAPTSSELIGFDLYTTENGDCFHCHSHSHPLLGDGIFRNNGLDSVSHQSEFNDYGRGYVTSYEFDNGKFRSVSLRNIEHTGPFMHDGRLLSLEDVIDHYDSGGYFSPTVDVNMKHTSDGGLGLTENEKTGLIDFLKMLSDTSLLTNPEYSNPFTANP